MKDTHTHTTSSIYRNYLPAVAVNGTDAERHQFKQKVWRRLPGQMMGGGAKDRRRGWGGRTEVPLSNAEGWAGGGRVRGGDDKSPFNAADTRLTAHVIIINTMEV